MKEEESTKLRMMSDTLEAPSLADFEETLKRLVDRITKILQAEKCVFLLHDAQTGSLHPSQPFIGFDPDTVNQFERRVSDDTVSSEVFRSNTSVILYDAVDDPRAIAEGLPQLGIRNGVSVPIVVEKRDDENRIQERSTVGVLHVFNKKSGGQFDEEDVRLLHRMAMHAAAFIASAEIYREVVQEKQELIHTIDSLFAGLLMVGNNGRIMQINPSARAILKLNPNSTLIGIPYNVAIPDERVRQYLETSLSAGSSEVVGEISVKNDKSDAEENSERIYQIQCAPVRDGHGAPAGVVAIFNDITEIRNVERMKTDFIRTVSHELRTPLTSIKGFIATLLDDKDEFYNYDQRREFYDIINTECDRLTRLIKDLLDIARIEQGRAMQMNWEQVDMKTLVQNVIAIQNAYVKNHELVMNFPENFPVITADVDKLGQIMTNLINNAIKYSPNGGKVTISGCYYSDDIPYVFIKVSDEGMGIAREHLGRLFDKFYRVDNRDNREIGGTGIGLAIVKALIEAHNGSVSVESEYGKGSTFTIRLPVAQPPHNDDEYVSTN